MSAVGVSDNTNTKKSGASSAAFAVEHLRSFVERVERHREGYYVLMQFTADASTVKEFERRLRVQDAVIKFLTVRIDETLKRLEKRRKEREKRAARRPAAAVPAPTMPGEERPLMPAAPAAPMPGAPVAPAAPAAAEPKEKE